MCVDMLHAVWTRPRNKQTSNQAHVLPLTYLVAIWFAKSKHLLLMNHQGDACKKIIIQTDVSDLKEN